MEAVREPVAEPPTCNYTTSARLECHGDVEICAFGFCYEEYRLIFRREDCDGWIQNGCEEFGYDVVVDRPLGEDVCTQDVDQEECCSS